MPKKSRHFFGYKKSHNSLVIRQKGESRNGCFKETKHAKFSENEHLLPPDTQTYVCVSGGKKCLFFGKFVVLCFLETPVLRFDELLPANSHSGGHLINIAVSRIHFRSA